MDSARDDTGQQDQQKSGVATDPVECLQQRTQPPETCHSPADGHVGASALDCQRMVDYAFRRNMVVKFMAEKLEEARFGEQLSFKM